MRTQLLDPSWKITWKGTLKGLVAFIILAVAFILIIAFQAAGVVNFLPGSLGVITIVVTICSLAVFLIWKFRLL